MFVTYQKPKDNQSYSIPKSQYLPTHITRVPQLFPILNLGRTGAYLGIFVELFYRRQCIYSRGEIPPKTWWVCVWERERIFIYFEKPTGISVSGYDHKRPGPVSQMETGCFREVINGFLKDRKAPRVLKRLQCLYWWRYDSLTLPTLITLNQSPILHSWKWYSDKFCTIIPEIPGVLQWWWLNNFRMSWMTWTISIISSLVSGPDMRLERG